MSVIWKNKYAALSEPKALFTVLIAAAGSGQRMGGVYKPLALLCGKPMLFYSLEAFEKSGFVKQIIISAPAEHHEEIGTMAKKYQAAACRFGRRHTRRIGHMRLSGGVPGQVGGHAFFGGA